MNSAIKFTYTTVRSFDLLCIGSYACKIGMQINSKLPEKHLRTLFSSFQHEVYQPALMVSDPNPFIWTHHRKLSQEDSHKNRVLLIDAENSKAIMQNGQVIKYKELIYSGQCFEWKDKNYYQNLKDSIETQHTAIYADQYCRNIQQLYLRNSGQIFISVPNKRHFGYQNYFMLHLQDSLIKRAINKKLAFNAKITVLLEGDTLFPFNQYHDCLLKNTLKENNIEVIRNCSIQRIDHQKRLVKLNGELVSFKSFYQYLPIKVPNLLSHSSIDPMNVNPNTLKSNQYSNISIIGNNLPTTHSFRSLTSQSQVIANNIGYSLLGINQLMNYDGNSMFPLWTAKDRVMYLAMNYNGQLGISNLLGSSWLMGKILAIDRKMSSKRRMESYLNGGKFLSNFGAFDKDQ